MKQLVLALLLPLCFLQEGIAQCTQLNWENLTKAQLVNGIIQNTAAKNGWTSGANSQERLPIGQDGFVEWTLDNIDSRYMIGLSDVPGKGNYRKISHAFYISNERLFIFEKRHLKKRFDGHLDAENIPLTLGNTLRVAREGKLIKYYLNQEVIHTSSSKDIQQKELLVDVAIHNTQNSIDHQIRTSFACDVIKISAEIEAETACQLGNIRRTTVTGGEPPYTYEWSNGVNTSDNLAIPNQTYSLTVKDRNQQATTAQFVLGKRQITWENRTQAELSSKGIINTAAKNGWTSGANSQERLPIGQDGFVEWTLDNINTRYMIGLSDVPGKGNYRKISHAFFVANARLFIYEKSHLIKRFDGHLDAENIPLTLGNTLRVAREGKLIKYYLNQEVIHTSSSKDIQQKELLVDLAIHDAQNNIDHQVRTSFACDVIKISAEIEAETGCQLGNIRRTTVTGGEPPYTYEWSNGVNTPDNLAIPNQTYSLTVKDRNQQTTTAQFVVEKHQVRWENRTQAELSSKGIINTAAKNGWTSGANSQERLPIGQDGFVEWTLDNIDSRYMIGLSDVPGKGNFRKISHAFYISNNKLLIYEKSHLIKRFDGHLDAENIPLTLGNTLRVAREGKLIKYYLNQEVIHTSSSKDIQQKELLVDLAIHDAQNNIDHQVHTSFACDVIKISAEIEAETACQLGNIRRTTVTGGEPPYTYEWSNGVNTPDNLAIPNQTYSLTVKDRNQQATTAQFVVEKHQVRWENRTQAELSSKGIINTAAKNGWTSGANSQERLPIGQDGFVEWTLDNIDSRYMIGLSDVPGKGNFRKISHAFYISNNKLLIYEKGFLKKRFDGYLDAENIPLTLGNTLRVAREGKLINYYLNDQVIYTNNSQNIRQKELLVDLAIHDAQSIIDHQVHTSFSCGKMTVYATLEHTNSCALGKIAVQPRGGTGNYTYQWSDGEETTAERSNLPVGNYEVTVSDGETTLTKTYVIEAAPLNWTTLTGITTTLTGLEKTGNDALAQTQQTLEGDGAIQWIWEQEGNDEFGLSDGNQNYQFHCIGNKTTLNGTEFTLVQGDILTLERQGTELHYYQNDDLIHTLTITTDPLFAFAKIHQEGGKMNHITSTFSENTTTIQNISLDFCDRQTGQLLIEVALENEEENEENTYEVKVNEQSQGEYTLENGVLTLDGFTDGFLVETVEIFRKGKSCGTTEEVNETFEKLHPITITDTHTALTCPEEGFLDLTLENGVVGATYQVILREEGSYPIQREIELTADQQLKIEELPTGLFLEEIEIISPQGCSFVTTLEEAIEIEQATEFSIKDVEIVNDDGCSPATTHTGKVIIYLENEKGQNLTKGIYLVTINGINHKIPLQIQGHQGALVVEGFSPRTKIPNIGIRYQSLQGKCLVQGKAFEPHLRINATDCPNHPSSTTIDLAAIARTEENCQNDPKRTAIPTTATINTIRTKRVLTPVTDEEDLENLVSGEQVTTHQFLDGLGRTIQTQVEGISPKERNLVFPKVYNEFGIEERQYLPYTVAGNQDLRYEALQEQCDFYHTEPTIKAAHTGTAYAEKQIEASPLFRTLRQGAAGENWQLNTKHTTQFLHRPNGEGEVMKWNVNEQGELVYQDYYPANQLTVQDITDEHGNHQRHYTTTEGLYLLKKVQIEGRWISHYYVYDDFNRLRYALPAGFFEHHSPTDYTTDDLNRWAYQYRYDERGRLIAKNLPDQEEWTYLVYDKRDRLVLSQTPKERDENQWAFIKYDQKNRVILTGLWESNTDVTDLRKQVAALRGEDLYETPANDEEHFHYTQNAFPKESTGENYDVLIATYYDTYDLDQDGHPNFDYPTHELIPKGQQPHAINGKKTVRKVKVLDQTDTYLTNVWFYDKYHQIIQKKVQYFGYPQKNQWDVQTFQYDFAKRITAYQEQTKIVENQAPEKTVETLLTYDHGGRLTQVHQKIDQQPELLIAAHQYNEIGQLMTKQLHSENETAFAQEVNYQYNIRGWMTHINDAQLSTKEQDNDLFGMELAYDKGFYEDYHNGNISGVKWKSQTDEVERAYGYRYDKQNRLTSADFIAKEGISQVWKNEWGNYDLRNVAYDDNNNITALHRKGLLSMTREDFSEELTKSYGEIDQLTFTYEGNRLQAVEDQIETDHLIHTTIAQDFSDQGSHEQNEYVYDAVGNLTADANKGIKNITYNDFNLPEKLTFDSGKEIQYIYNARGLKLREITKNSPFDTKITDYAGSFTYQEEALAAISMSNGKIVMDNADDFHYEYHLYDHLGNVRLTFRPDVEEETTDYLLTMEIAKKAEEKTHFTPYLSARTSEQAHQGQYGILLDQNINTLHFKKEDKTQFFVAGNTEIQATVWAKYAVEDIEQQEENGRVEQASTTENTVLKNRKVPQFTLFTPPLIATPLHTGNEPKQNAPQVNLLSVLQLGKVLLTPPQKKEEQVLEPLHFPAPAKDVQQLPLPEAFLIIEFYNEEGELIEITQKELTTNAKGEWEEIKSTYKTPQKGTVKIYIQNRDAHQNVFWDDFNVKFNQQKPQILNEFHYYPFGMQLKGLGSEEQLQTRMDDFEMNPYRQDLNWNDLGFRQYDIQLGRFHVADPLQEIDLDGTAYQFALNNPINNNDLLGLTDNEGNEETYSWQILADGTFSIFDQNGNNPFEKNQSTQATTPNEGDQQQEIVASGTAKVITEVKQENQQQEVTEINEIDTQEDQIGIKTTTYYPTKEENIIVDYTSGGAYKNRDKSIRIKGGNEISILSNDPTTNGKIQKNALGNIGNRTPNATQIAHANNGLHNMYDPLTGNFTPNQPDGSVSIHEGETFLDIGEELPGGTNTGNDNPKGSYFIDHTGMAEAETIHKNIQDYGVHLGFDSKVHVTKETLDGQCFGCDKAKDDLSDTSEESWTVKDCQKSGDECFYENKMIVHYQEVMDNGIKRIKLKLTVIFRGGAIKLHESILNGRDPNSPEVLQEIREIEADLTLQTFKRLPNQKLVNQYKKNERGTLYLDETGNPVIEKQTENKQIARFENISLLGLASYAVKNRKLHPALWDDYQGDPKAAAAYKASPIHWFPEDVGLIDYWVKDIEGMVKLGAAGVKFHQKHLSTPLHQISFAMTTWKTMKPLIGKLSQLDQEKVDAITAPIIDKMVKGGIKQAGIALGEEGESRRKYQDGQIAGFVSSFFVGIGEVKAAANFIKGALKGSSKVLDDVGEGLFKQISRRTTAEVIDPAIKGVQNGLNLKLTDISQKLVDDFAETWHKADDLFKKALNDKPELFDAWEALHKAGVDDILKKDLKELNRISTRLDEIAAAGGYNKWEYRMHLVSSGGKKSKVIGKFVKGEELEIISKSTIYGGNIVKLSKNKTTTITGVLDDVNVVRRRGADSKGFNGLTKTGENTGAINTLFSPKWGKIQSKYKYLKDAGDEMTFWKKVTDEFWETVNKPWLEDAIKRGDAIRFVSDPSNAKNIFVTNKSGQFVLDSNGNKIKSIFGREVDLLRDNGYTILSNGIAVK